MKTPEQNAIQSAADREAFNRAAELEALQIKAAAGDLTAAHRVRKLQSVAHLATPGRDDRIGLTKPEAARYKRDWIAMHGFWSHQAKRQFLDNFFVIEEDEPLPLPTSPTSHPELLAQRAEAKRSGFLSGVGAAIGRVVTAKPTPADATPDAEKPKPLQGKTFFS